MVSLLVLVICATSIGLMFSKNLLSMVVISGLVSLLSMMFYVLNLAPDVAITEAAVGSAISTIFFGLSVLACIMYEGKTESDGIIFKADKPIIIACSILFILLSFLATKLDIYGDPTNIIHSGISEHYILNTKKDFEIPNIVTAILGGYRGLDTLFETAVIFAAAMGVRSILVDKNEE